MQVVQCRLKKVPGRGELGNVKRGLLFFLTATTMSLRWGHGS